MFLLLVLLSQSHANADSLRLPPEMQQRVDEAGSAVAEGMRAAHRKLDKAQKESDLVHSLSLDLGKLWTGVKHKSRSALVYFDHELHEHVIGPEGALENK